MSADPAGTTPRPTGGRGVTRFATRGDHRLSYESTGATEGTPVLALHDLLADRGQLRALAETVPGGSFRLTLPDARGHGASPMISGRAYPTTELVADTLAVLDAEGLSTAHVVAVGWGAGTALGLALSAPERVSSLALADPYLPPLSAHAHHLEVVQEAAGAAEKGQIDRALDLYLGLRLGEDWRDGLPKARLGAMRRAAGSLAPLLLGMTSTPFTREALGPIDIPVTILVMEDAPEIERQMADSLAALVPRSRLTSLRPEPDAYPTLEGRLAASLAEALVVGR